MIVSVVSLYNTYLQGQCSSASLSPSLFSSLGTTVVPRTFTHDGDRGIIVIYRFYMLV